MNLILIEQKDFIEHNKIVLTGRRAHHIADVLKAQIGQQLIVGEVNGKMGHAVMVSKKAYQLELTVRLSHSPPKSLPVTLVLALPRPIVLKRLLVTVTTLGIKKIILLHSRRVEKSYWHSPVLSEDTIRKQLMLGLEQSKDTLLPEVQLKKRFKPFLGDELPSLVKEATPIIALPQEKPLAAVPRKKPAVLVIGPEGGFIPWEEEQFMRLGFFPLSLGKRILKVETAVCAAVGKMFL